MAAAVLATPTLHDPFQPKVSHHPPSELAALLDLLAVDNLIDASAPPAAETNLINDLLAVDLEFDRADARAHRAVATAPELKEDKNLFLDLLRVDREVDAAKGATSSADAQRPRGGAMHDPYARVERRAVERFHGVYGHDNPAITKGKKEEHELLRDNATMMHLLAVDESVDNTKRYQSLVASDGYAIIGELYEVDKEVSGAQTRVHLVEDLQCLLDVDHLVDGVKQLTDDVADQATGGAEGKRSIFSVKEKYTAKVANKYQS